MNVLIVLGLFLLVVGGSILAVRRGSSRVDGTAGFDSATKVALACFVGAIVLFIVAVATRSSGA
jgi:hypothetical protein